MKNSKSSSEKEQEFQNNQQLKPVMKQILVFTAKTTWKLMKMLVKTAFLIPGMVKKLVQEKQTATNATHVKNKRE